MNSNLGAEVNNPNPIVSVCMVTYNHDHWIGQSIEGVLKQRTNFAFELVISDDCSTDSTPEIIKRYVGKYPTLIRPRFNEKNVGLAINFSDSLTNCRGKYIAICEGDDFWTDPFKLQKQVDFLDNNQDCIIVSHNYSILNESMNQLDQNNKFHDDFRYNQEKYLLDWVTQPLTCMFRNFFKDYTLLNKEDIFCDVILFYELLKHGDGYFMNSNMATFRVHQSALSSGLSRGQWLRNHVIMFDHLYKSNKRDDLLLKLSRNYCLSLYIYEIQNKRSMNNDFKPLREYLKRTRRFQSRIFTLIVRAPYYIIRHGLISRL